MGVKIKIYLTIFSYSKSHIFYQFLTIEYEFKHRKLISFLELYSYFQCSDY
jgi:hypothetical protein